MTGYTERAVIEKGILQPGSPVLSKPFNRFSLTAKVREVLDGGA